MSEALWYDVGARDRASRTFGQLADAVGDVRDEMRRLDRTKARATVEVDTDKADAQLEKFSKNLHKKIDTAVKALPPVTLTADSSDTDRELARVRNDLLDLSKQRIGVDIDAGQAELRVRELRATLARLNAESVDIKVKTDTLAAVKALGAVKLEAVDIKNEVDKASASLDKFGRDGARAAADVDRGFADTTIRIAALGTALARIAIPASIVAAAPQLASLGAAALSASGAIGLLPAVGAAAAGSIAALAVGMAHFSDALGETDTPAKAKKVAEAMAALAPAAREAVTAIRALGPAWSAMRLDVQERLFDGLAKKIQQIGNTYIPILWERFARVADAANGAAQSIALMLTTASRIADMKFVGDQAATAFENLAKTVGPLAAAFLDIAAVGAEFLPELTAGVRDATQNFRDFVAAARESGQLRAWIQGGIDTLGQLWDITKNVAKALKGIFDAAELGGVDVLGGLERATRGLAEAINSIEGQRDIATVFREISETFTALWHASEPVRDVLSTLASTVLPALLQVLQWVAPVLVPLVSGLLALRLAAAGFAKVRALPDWLGTAQARAVGASSALQRFREELRLQQALAQGAGQSVGMFGAALGLVESRMGQLVRNAAEASSGWHNLARATDEAGQRLATSIPQAAERAGTALQGALVGGLERVARGVEIAGRAVSAGLASGLDSAAAGVQRLGRGFEWLGQAAVAGMNRTADTVRSLPSIVGRVADQIGSTLTDGIAAGLRGLDKVGDVAVSGLAASFNGLSLAGDKLTDGLIAGFRGLSLAGDKITDGLIGGFKLLGAAGDKLTDGLAAGFRGLSTVGDKITNGLGASFRALSTAGDRLTDGLATGFRAATTAGDLMTTGLGAGFRALSTAGDALVTGLTRIRDIPALVASGLQTGIVSAANAASTAMTNVATATTNAANVIRNLPSVTDAASTSIRGIGTAVTNLPETFSRLGTAVGSAADGIASGLSRAMTAMGTFSNVVGTVGSAIGSGLTRAATSLVSFLGGPWGVAFAAASVALGLFAQNQAEAAQTAAEYKQRVEEIKNTLNGYDAAVTSATTALQAHDIASRTLSDGTTSFATALQAAGVDLKDYTAAATGNEQALAKVNGQLVKSAQEMPRLQQFWNGYRTELDAAGISYDTLAAAAIGNSQALEQVGNALGLGTGYLREQFDTITGGVGELGSALGAYAGQVKEAQEQTRTAAQAAGDFSTTLATIKPGLAGLKDGAAPLPPMAAAFKDLATSASESAQAAGEAAAQYGGSAAGAEAARAKMQELRQAFIDSIPPTVMSREEAGKLADQIGLIPANVATTFTTNATAVVAEIDGLKIRIDSTTGTIIIDGDPNPATGKVTQAVTFADGSTGTITVDARPDPATGKINGTVTYADGSTGTITIDGNQKPADGKIEATVTKADGSTGTVKIDADTSSAEEKLRAFLATPRTITVRTNVVASGSVQGGAGGFVAGFAGGGVVGGGKVHKFAGGGRVFPGYAPGRDRIPALLSPGEAVLVPELVRRWGADNIMRANMLASGGRPGTRVGRVPNSMAKGTGMAAAAAEILAQRDRGGDVFEDFSFYGNSDNVSNWNDRITDLYGRSGIVDDDDFLRAVIAGTIGPKQPTFGGGMVRGSGRSGSPDVVAAVSSLRGQLSGLRSQMAAVTDAVRSARPITVEDRSGSPTETARMTQLALRLA